MNAEPVSEAVLENGLQQCVIHVVEHQVLTPSGTPGICGVVRFKNRAVGVVPYEDGDIWLVDQYRFPLDRYSWEIPEGGPPPSETLLQTAERELREETGLRARRFDCIVRMHLSNSAPTSTRRRSSREI